MHHAHFCHLLAGRPIAVKIEVGCIAIFLAVFIILLGSARGARESSYVSLSHEISLKSLFGYFAMCIILKTSAFADYFGISVFM